MRGRSEPEPFLSSRLSLRKKRLCLSRQAALAADHAPLGHSAFLLLGSAAPDLCAGSTDPASCSAIVADAVLASPRSARYSSRRPAQVLRAIVAGSLVQHDAAAAAVAGMHRTASSSDTRGSPRRSRTASS